MWVAIIFLLVVHWQGPKLEFVTSGDAFYIIWKVILFARIDFYI
jgi:hypothetical protein